jgi:pyruvate/2-oxoglutarate dehydrogenase complex dihydrolipoamide acyltransferase (E2) component
MAQAYPLPKWGVTMEEGTIVEWNVQPGEPLEEGTVIGQVETDKIVVEFVSPVKGIMGAHLVEPGTTVAVGEDIVVIAGDEHDYQAYLASLGG